MTKGSLYFYQSRFFAIKCKIAAFFRNQSRQCCIVLCNIEYIFWYISFYWCSLEEANWKFQKPFLFLRSTVFLDFLIMSLFKVFIKFSYCIISIASMLLHLFCLRIYTVITFASLLFVFTIVIFCIYLWLQTISVRCGLVNCTLV